MSRKPLPPSFLAMIILAGMIILHNVSGSPVEVNPDQITHLRNPEPPGKEHSFTEKAHCMVNMADGKFVTVTETCAEVRRAIEEQRK